MGNSAWQPLLPLVNALRSGELPLPVYLDHLQGRFEESEPAVQAFMPEAGRFERLRRQAAALEARYPERENRPPLYGVPIGVKDIFHADGFPTTAGSRLPPAELKGREARSVTLLKEAGALVMGKTVSTEFAYFGPGPTRNPRNLDHTPGGSSSGSAAAIAAGLCPIALGTQTIGSICRPASFCGVVGFKPSYDRVARFGVIPLAPSLDHVGVFTREVASIELTGGLLCPDWHLAVSERRPVLGVPVGPYLDRADDFMQAHFQETCRRLEEAGCLVKPVSTLADLNEIVARHNLILAAEAAQVHADWYDHFSQLYHPKTVELIERGRAISVGDLANALIGRQRLRRELTAVMDEAGLDLWIAPAAPGPAPRGLDSTGDPIMNLPWTHAGLPTISLPSGQTTDGLPLGLQVVGRWYEDEMLLDWAADIELIIKPDDG